jgi:protein tyrosine/serine phosphatase
VRYEMPLSAANELTSDQLRELLSLLRKARKPVLIHSKSGADRTGLAAAITFLLCYSPSGPVLGRSCPPISIPQ